MGCSECKKNKTIKEDLLKSTEFVQKGIIWFVLIWSIFAIYGIYTFINLFI
jgi:hypothetical protein